VWVLQQISYAFQRCKILKMVKIRQSYIQFKGGNFFGDTVYIADLNEDCSLTADVCQACVCVCCLHAVTVEFRVNFSTAVVSALCHVTAQAYSMFFWATICKKVRPMLSDHCMSRFSVCDVGALRLNIWMDQDEAGYEGKPRPRPHCVRWGNQSPPKGGIAPNFWPMSVVAKRLDGLRCNLV